MNKKSLESGKEYTLADIFSGENKIIIPDLQRDYCWGGKAHDKDNKVYELVTDFVTSLIDLFKINRQDKFTLGLIYGYEQPKSHIQLCDGQQRITTLFLLLGILNRKTNGKFQKYLISDFELNEDDKEPYLQYAIRESTLYFLSDLVCEFFLKKDLAIDKIEKQDWYFNEYKLDASITSMIEALNLIEKRFDREANFDFSDFGDFIVENLQVLYYDMGNREQGEETFVVINTTGDPLTATENLKPIFINSLPIEKQSEASRLWEEWETFFWKNRKGAGEKKNDTADRGLLEFFRWLILLSTDNKKTFEQITKGGKVNIDNLQLKDIQQYFEIVEFAFTDSEIFPNNKDWLAPENMNDQITWFRVLPVIEYIKRFGKDNLRDILRVKKFFKNMARNGNVGRDIANMLPLAIRIIKELDAQKELSSGDIASIIFMENVSKTLLTDEERLKFRLYMLAANREREELEDCFWKEEDHDVWVGEIIPILEWSGGENNFDFDLFKKYSKVFSILFHDQMNYEELDITRRALLTRALSAYPRIFKGSTNYSFCWEYSDWKTLINDNKDKFKLFFDELLGKEELAIYQEMNSMIENNPNNKDFDEFVKIPELLEYCKKKNIQWGNDQGWILIQWDKRSGPHANLKSYRLYLDLRDKILGNKDTWKLNFDPSHNTCCYLDYKDKGIAINILFSETIEGTDKYQLLLFKREEREDGKEKLSPIAEICSLSWREASSENYYRYESPLLNKDAIIERLQKVMEAIGITYPND